MLDGPCVDDIVAIFSDHEKPIDRQRACNMYIYINKLFAHL